MEVTAGRGSRLFRFIGILVPHWATTCFLNRRKSSATALTALVLMSLSPGLILPVSFGWGYTAEINYVGTCGVHLSPHGSVAASECFRVRADDRAPMFVASDNGVAGTIPY
jgi:hypothetical protein